MVLDGAADDTAGWACVADTAITARLTVGACVVVCWRKVVCANELCIDVCVCNKELPVKVIKRSDWVQKAMVNSLTFLINDKG